MSGDDALALAWRHQSELSAAASDLKSSQSVWRRSALIALVVGAALETGALQFDGGSAAQRALALAGAAALAFVPVVRATKLPSSAVLDWTRLRSASEAVKSDVYRYVTRVGPYRDDVERSERLGSDVDDVVDRVRDLGNHLAMVEPDERPAPGPMSMGDYLEQRVGSQIQGYYRPRARENSRQLKRLRRIEFVLTVSAAILAAVSAFGPSSIAGWVAAITTTAGAFAAHREATRVEQQAISYHATANRLESLRTNWAGRLAARELTATEEDELVAECEGAISVENQAWMAMWTEAGGASA